MNVENNGTDQIRALERVRKMLALANDAAASEGERDNALRMAHATLAKYNLSLVDAERGPDEARVDIGVEVYCWPWMRTTSNAIAQLLFCKFFSARTRKNYVKHYFVGLQSNAVTARDLSLYLIKSIEKEAKVLKRATPNTGPDFVLAFCKGASHKVYWRCDDLRRDAERASREAPTAQSTGTALVLASVYQREVGANSAYLADVLKITLRSGRSGERRVSSLAAYTAGAEFGSKISLNRQVGVAQPSKSLSLGE